MTDTLEPDKTHPQYKDMVEVWAACRAAKKGQRAIHAGGTTYLPRLSGQTDNEYSAYMMRAQFYNATGRTVEGMVGLLFRKKPNRTILPAMEPWEKDINLAGLSAEGLARKITEDVLVVGRGGLLVDHTVSPVNQDGTRMTMAQAANSNQRPYLTYYVAEDILDWELGRVNNIIKLVRVALSEKVSELESKDGLQVRELALVDGRYIQNIYRKNDKGWFLFETLVPVKNGSALPEIPFLFVGPKEPDSNVQDPPIEDLVYVNISHYRNSADLENGIHKSGLPVLAIIGLQNKINEKGEEIPTEVQVGTDTALILPEGGDAKYIQCGESGFTALENAMDRKEEQMAALGARMIAPEKKQAEAAETAGIRRGGENSVLASIAGVISMQIEKALRMMADWAGLNANEVTYALNKDYLPMAMDAATLTALMNAWQSGGISEQTLFECLQAGEIIDESVTFEDEQERKAESGPAPGMVGRDDE